MKIAPLAASILGCAWILISAADSPELLPDSKKDLFRIEETHDNSLPTTVTDSISHRKDTTTTFKVLIMPID